MAEDARAAHKAGPLPVYLLNSLWDLQTFKTSLKLHLSPAVSTNMGCHFKRDSRNPISWSHSGLSLMTKRASGWSLLAKSSLLFCVFFYFYPFLGLMEESEQGWGLHKPQGRMEAGVPSSSLVWFVQRGWDMYQTRITRPVMARLTGPYLWSLLLLPGPAFAFSQPCCLPTAGSQTSCCNNPKLVCVSLNGLGFTWLSGDVTLWDRAPFPWHQPQMWLTALCSTQLSPSTNTDAAAIARSLCEMVSVSSAGKKGKKNPISMWSAVDLLLRRVNSVVPRSDGEAAVLPSRWELAGSGCAEQLLPP